MAERVKHSVRRTTPPGRLASAISTAGLAVSEFPDWDGDPDKLLDLALPGDHLTPELLELRFEEIEVLRRNRQQMAAARNGDNNA